MSLSKSRFVEMFGTPVTNNKKWETVPLKQACSLITDGSHFSPEAEENGEYPMLSVKDMGENNFNYDECKYIGKETFNNLVSNGCCPQKNDVLVAKDGSYWKKAFVVNEDKKQVLLSSIAILRPDNQKISSRFLRDYVLSKEITSLVDRQFVTGTALKRVILKGIREIPIYLPPIELQKKYEKQINQLDKSKFLLQKILEKLELLKKSRFVEMFGDPVLNPYKLKKDSFRHICEELFAGGDKPSDIVLTKDETHPYPVYANGYENLGFMGFSSQCRVNKPAITISARGTIGFSCIRQAGFTPIVRLLTLIPKTGIDLDYLKFAIDFYSFTSSGTSQKQLTVPDIAKYEVLVPDYSSQQCFATFVHQLDKSKLVIQKSLEDLVGKS